MSEGRGVNIKQNEGTEFYQRTGGSGTTFSDQRKGNANIVQEGGVRESVPFVRTSPTSDKTPEGDGVAQTDIRHQQDFVSPEIRSYLKFLVDCIAEASSSSTSASGSGNDQREEDLKAWLEEINKVVATSNPYIYSTSSTVLTLRSYIIGCFLEAAKVDRENSKRKTTSSLLLNALLSQIERGNSTDLGLLYGTLLEAYQTTRTKSTNLESTSSFASVVNYWLPLEEKKSRIESARIAFGIGVFICASNDQNSSLVNSAATFCNDAIQKFSAPNLEQQPWYGSLHLLYYLKTNLLTKEDKNVDTSITDQSAIGTISDFVPSKIDFAAMDQFGGFPSSSSSSSTINHNAATSSVVGSSNTTAAASTLLSEQLSSSHDVIRMLNELGPSCASSASRFRDTLRQLLPGGRMDETCLAHLVYFVSSKVASGGNASRRTSSSDKEVSDILVGTLLSKSTSAEGSAGGETSDHTGDSNNGGWNLNRICEVLSDDYGSPRCDWELVAQSMEYVSNFRIRNAEHLEVFLETFRLASGGMVFPPLVVVNKWNSAGAEGQLSLLIAIATSSLRPLGSGASSKVVYSFPLDEEERTDLQLMMSSTSSVDPPPYTPWACGMFLLRLLLMMDYPHLKTLVYKVFEQGFEKLAPMLLCCLERLNKRLTMASGSNPEHLRCSEYCRDIIGSMSLPLFKPISNYSPESIKRMITQLWSNIDRFAVVRGCRNYWNHIQQVDQQDPQSATSHTAILSMVLHTIEIMKVIGPESEGTFLFGSTGGASDTSSNNKTNSTNGIGSDAFTISVAFVLADQRLTNLEVWLNDRINTLGIPFLIKLLSFLQNSISDSNPRRNPPDALLSKENLLLTMRILDSLDSSVINQVLPNGGGLVELSTTITIRDVIHQVLELCFQRYPDFQSILSRGGLQQGVDAGVVGGQQVVSVSSPNPAVPNNDDIEEMANSYFQKIYTSENGINEVVDMLKKFKISGNQRENDIFACMIHNLFDEYRFFSKYPEKELRITGILFGKLIKEQLVSSITLGIALRYVLEALRKDPGVGGTNSATGKMFRFGMFALEQFKERLHEWPQYCSHIVQISHLRAGYQELVQEIDAASHASQVQQQQQQQQQLSGQHQHRPHPQSLPNVVVHGGGTIATGTVLVGDSGSNSGAMTPVTSAPNSPRIVPPRSPAGSVDSSNNPNMRILPNSLPATSSSSTSDFLPPGGVNNLTVSNIVPNTNSAHQRASSTGANSVGSTGISVASTASAVTTSQLVPAAREFIPRREAVFGPGLGKAFHKQVSDSAPPLEAPTDKTADRVQFIINNLSLSNVESKSRELVEVLPSKNFQWFASILVVKRISTQPNYHTLYLTLLDNLGEYGKGLVDAILEHVYLNIGKLLRSAKITTSTSERSLLKNLGSWLGQMTLRRNRPILQITLDCKELLYQGYETGRLIAVTPFVAKILEGAKHSFVFQPPNPWVMGLLQVFRALYDVDDLKMNIKFEVEVLCKNLSVKLDDIPCLMAKRTLARRIPPLKEKNPDFNIKSTSSSSTAGSAASGAAGTVMSVGGGQQSVPATPDRKVPSSMMSGGAPGVATSSSLVGPSGHGATPTSSSAASAGAAEQQQPQIPNLAEYVTINSQLFSVMPSSLSPTTFQRAVILAVDRAITEVIQPIIERSVNIACTTTKEIITKDFAVEPDETRMRKAARLMVANLAGSLALVSCRDALRSNLASHLRNLLTQEIVRSAAASGSASSVVAQLTDQEKVAIDHCVVTCASDNLELGVTLIEKAVIEKAVRDTDDMLLEQFQIRIKHREETGGNPPFYDVSIYTPNNRYPAALPEALRCKPGIGLRPDQLMVYDSFNAQAPAAVVSASRPGSVVSGGGSTTSTPSSRQPTPTPPPQSQPSPAPQAHPGADASGTGSQNWSMEALSSLATKLNHSVTVVLNANASRASEITLSMLPQEHDVKQILFALQRYAAHARQHRPLNTIEQESVLAFAQSVFRRLYDLSLTEPLRLEALVALLEALNECCPQLGNDMGTWATYAPTETDAQRQHHLTILLLLVRSRLVPIAEVDDLLAKNADMGRSTKWLDFSLLFIRAAVLERIALASQMPKTLQMLNTILSNASEGTMQEQFVKPIARVMSDIQKASGGVSVVGSSGITASQQQQQQQQQQTAGPNSSNSGSGGDSGSIRHTMGPSVVSSAAASTQSPMTQQTQDCSVAMAPIMPETSSLLKIATRRAAETTELLVQSDPAGSRQQVAILLENWIRLHYETSTSSEGVTIDTLSPKMLGQYLQLLQQNGIGKLDEPTERFIRYSTELVVEAVLQSAGSAATTTTERAQSPPTVTDTGAPVLNYTVADSYSKLLLALIRHMNHGGTTPEEVGVQRIALLNKILGITLRTMMSHYHDRHSSSGQQHREEESSSASASKWDQRPWFRILHNLIQDLCTPSPLLDPISFGISSVIGSALHIVQPSVMPGFAFAWLELVSHRMFLSRLLLVEEDRKGWPIYHQLLIDLFIFMEPYLRQTLEFAKNDALQTLLKGTLRVLLVLLHDVPLFLASYHLSLCNVIPEHCIQLRNLVLSAFPRHMVLPDPFTPNLKIDLLPEIHSNPILLSNVTGPLLVTASPSSTAAASTRDGVTLLAELDQYLKSADGASSGGGNSNVTTSFLRTLLPRLSKNTSTPPGTTIPAGNDLDAPRINSLVLYVGIQAIARLQQEQQQEDASSSSSQQKNKRMMVHTAEMELFMKLMELDEYGRYVCLNAIANQLRFPSSHTHYFSCVMLYLFGETNDEGVKEQITRVLLERLIVHRPHPWGLLVTFIELIKNQRYNFWSHSFVRCATEIEKVFESVARSCMAPGGGGGGPGAFASTTTATAAASVVSQPPPTQRVATTVGSPQ